MNRQKILIVDDSEMNREILKAILGEGYKYTEAEDGAQALRMLRQDMNIDLMLLDINMPKVDGFTVLEYMNQFRWIDEIPVVMISAADDHESIERCYGLGVSDYIRRPFDAFIVQRRVRLALMQSGGEQQRHRRDQQQDERLRGAAQGPVFHGSPSVRSFS